MIKYEVSRHKGRVVWLEVEEGAAQAELVEETRIPSAVAPGPDAWTRHSIRVPVEGLRQALAKVTIRHEVG